MQAGIRTTVCGERLATPSVAMRRVADPGHRYWGCSVNFAGFPSLRPHHNYGYAPSPGIGGIIPLLTGRLNF